MNTISSILKFIAETITPICGTQTGNKVLASPNGSTGAPTFRKLAVNDLPVVVHPPVGGVEMFAGANVPSGWLVCDGRAVSRSTYSTLFNVIGTAYGSGDGSTTFNLPDFRDRVPVGGGTSYSRGSAGGAATRSYTPAGTNSGGAVQNHTLTISEMPSHSHTTGAYFYKNSAAALTHYAVELGVGENTVNTTSVGGSGAHNHGFTQPTFKGTQATIDVRQPYLGIYFIIYSGVA